MVVPTKRNGDEIHVGPTSSEEAYRYFVAGETEMAKEKFPEEFSIDMGLCIFCGYCQEVCPVEAIWLKEEYELADFNRTDLIFQKEKLLEMGRRPPYLPGKEKPLEEK